MKNNLKKMLVLLLAANMFAGATVPVFAEDSVTPGTTQETITNPDGTTTEITTTTTVTPGETEGTTDINIEIDKKTEGTTADGTKVEGEDHREETKTVDEEDTVISSSMREEGTETRTEEDGRVIESGYEGGSDMTTEENGVDNITVDVPLTDTDDPETEDVAENVNTVEGREEGTVISQKTEMIDGKETTVTEKVHQSAEVTVTTNEITVESKVITPVEREIDTDGDGIADTVISEVDVDGDGVMDFTIDEFKYVYATVTPDKGENGDGNDLFTWVFRGNRLELPAEGEVIEVEEGYEYKYLGAGNSSQILPTFLYTSPSEDNPDQEPAYIDEEGNKYYLRDKNGAIFNDVYHDGERYDVEEGYKSVFSVPQQFVLVDAATGELVTAYCADAETPTSKGYNYYVENLEDADYYNDEQAAMIRTITEHGYWGVEGTEIDENGNEVPKMGSLESMKQHLLASGEFTADELAYLTDGVALTATQMSIWKFSNAMSGMEFLNAIHSKTPNAQNEISTSWASGLTRTDVTSLSEDEKKSVDLLYKLYEYMINMEPTAAENEDGIKETSNNIINADNFVKDMEITVIEKAEDHENNQNDDDTDDAYVTDITFALEIVPSTENGDDLVVKVIGYNADGSTYEVASARIAGENKEGENYQMLESKDGNYKFEGITITEGDHTFNITLEGIQNLEKGVYLYTSEVRTGEDGSEESSQTLVGLAEGTRGVNVNMDIKFDLNVEDEVVATEHVWHDEWERDPYDPEDEPEDPTPDPEPKDPKPEPKKPTPEPKKPEPKGKKYSFKVKIETEPEEIVEIEDEDIPLVDIPDEAIPLTDIPDEPIPQTGDSMFWYITGTIAALALSVLSLGKKGKKENA